MNYLTNTNIGITAITTGIVSGIGYYFLKDKLLNYNDQPKKVTRDHYNLLNLTPHDVVVYTDNKELLYAIPRLDANLRLVGGMNDYQLEKMKLGEETHDIKVRNNTQYSDVSGLDIVKQKYDSFDKDIIVSGLVADFLILNKAKYKGLCQHVLVPDTDPKSVIRSDEGRIIGVQAFINYGCLA